MNTTAKSYLSDKSISEKKTFGVNSSSFSDPLTLFRELSTLRDKSDLSDKCRHTPIPIHQATNPNYPPLPDMEPTFTPEQEHTLADFYASRPRAERLAMHKRSLYIRAEKGWAWPACDLTAYREAWTAAGKPSGPFTMSGNGLVMGAV